MKNFRRLSFRVLSVYNQIPRQTYINENLEKLFCSKSNNFENSNKSRDKNTDSSFEVSKLMMFIKLKKKLISLKLPEEPSNCCMSGCENCVWKKYAEDLTDLYQDSGEQAKKVILEKIKDPSMQVFLKMELEFLTKKK